MFWVALIIVIWLTCSGKTVVVTHVVERAPEASWPPWSPVEERVQEHYERERYEREEPPG